MLKEADTEPNASAACDNGGESEITPVVQVNKTDEDETNEGADSVSERIDANLAETGQQPGLEAKPEEERGASLGVLVTIVVCQFAGTSLWFAPNAVVGGIAEFDATEGAALTSMVQVGFIIGTFTLTYSALTDRLPATLIFTVCSVLGAILNAICGLTRTFAVWAVLRLLVGISLAGVYPVGMKIAAQQFPQGLGARLGLLVGALALGTALPWLFVSLSVEGEPLPVQTTLLAVSGLAVMGGALMIFVIPAKRAKKTAGSPPLSFGRQNLVVMWADQDFRNAALGYWGHMWELYALWAHVPQLITAHAVEVQEGVISIPFSVFLFIAMGAPSSALAGLWSLYSGTEKIPGSAVAAETSLIVSGVCCLLAPAYRSMSREVFFVYLLVWGSAVVADSGQYSTLCAKYAPKHLVGTALTMTTCIGFAITIVSIQGVAALLKAGVDPGMALLTLAVGPLVGTIASYRSWPLHKLCR